MARTIRYSEGLLAEFPSLLLPKQAAHTLSVTEHTLAQWRSDGFGPKYVRVGRLIRYKAADVAAWVQARSVTPGAKPPVRASHKNEALARQTAETA